MTSNTILASLLIVAILVSVASLVLQQQPQVVKLSGRNIDTASASATVSSTTVLNWTTSSIAWGTGTVVPGKDFCTLDTSDGSTTNCTGFSGVSTGVQLENTGNTDVKLNLSSNKNATAFLQGTSPVFQWKLASNEAGSCAGSLNDTSYTNVEVVSTEKCSNFMALDASDTISMNLKIRIPSDSVAAAKSATITAQGTSL